MGRLDTCYAPVRRSPSGIASYSNAAPRLACVKPVASVHPEPGSNSSSYKTIIIYHLNIYHLPFDSIWKRINGNKCLICDDACPGLLSLSFRILTVRFSCTTISVYVILSKTVLQRSALSPYPSHGTVRSHLRMQRYDFS